MANPRFEINLDRIYHNSKVIVNNCLQQGIDVLGVTKSVCALPEVVKVLLAAGVKKLGDSRLQNIVRMRRAGIKCEIALLRIPMLSEAVEAVQFADRSYQSELLVIEEFNKAARKLDKIHKVVLMVEVGDLREGVLPKDLDFIVEKIVMLSNIHLEGLGMNVGCYGGVLPSFENTSLLVQLKEHLAQKFKLALPVVSGGSSSTLKLMETGQLAPGVTEIRVGEGIFLGTGASYGGTIPGAYTNALKFVAEIIEIREKPSVPTGEINKDAFGRKPHYVDRGMRKRAILAVGRQDVSPDALIPLLPGVEILGASSDHLIVDLTECIKDFQVGDEISFLPDYGGLLGLMTSPYVEKMLVREMPKKSTKWLKKLVMTL